ncbi:MAG: ABC transporter ATP-binding protein [Spirochaetes bacterium]|nr:ABC transporter ATP-binding protein [Spirochaetota bacterium]
MQALSIRNLSYRYPGGKEALRGIDLDVPAGSKTALIGKNGSGKTTLLLHINGLLDGEGIIEVTGIRRAPGTMGEIRKRVGLLFGQTEYHFIMTDLLRDVMLSLQELEPDMERRREAALGWLSRFGLDEYAASSPLDLSTGEMKRAALAGVLARNPSLLVLDEPLSGLDRESALDLVAMLRGIATTMIISTHRLFIAERLATHIAVIEEGRIAGFYPAARALRKKGVRDLLF